MFALLWVAFAGLSAAQYGCTEATNGTKTSCLAPSYVECLDQCTLQSYEEQCLSFPGCRWNASEYIQHCSSPLTNTCRVLKNATECTNVTGCLWHTTLCKDTRYCYANNTPPSGGGPWCLTAQTESACAALGSACYMRESCINTNRCDINEDQNSCTATAGCFWYETVLTDSTVTNYSVSESRCQECFGLPTHNLYLRYRGWIGQVCNISAAQVFMRVMSAVPSATGCDGGVPLPLGPVDCVPFTTSSAGRLSAFPAMLFAASLLLILE